MNKILFVIIFIISATTLADEEAPTTEQLLNKFESNSVYKEVLDKGFTGKNKNLDVAIIEVMATKEITEKTSKGLSEEQLDLLGPILAYGYRAKQLPDKLVKAFEKSPNLRFTVKATTVFEERVGEYVSYSCYEPGMSPVIAFPESHDKSVAEGKMYAKIINVEKLAKGVASFLYMPRSLIRESRRDMNEGIKFEKSLDSLKPIKIGDETMKPDDIQKKLLESKSKYLWLTVNPWNIQNQNEINGGRGVLLTVWNSKISAPPIVLRMPFKEFVQHAKTSGWEGQMRPGCEDGDSVEVIAEFKGKTTLTNKLGVLIEAAIVEAVAVNDGFSFYKSK